MPRIPDVAQAIVDATPAKPKKSPAKKSTPSKPAAPDPAPKPSTPAPTPAPAPQPAAATTDPNGRPIIYPEVIARVRHGADAITYDWACKALGYEDEKTYGARMAAKNPGTKPEDHTFKDDYFAKNVDGVPVRCWQNMDNRPFEEEWSNGLSQTVLKRNWAGPTTIPGETVNGSTIVISRTGRVESGQHSLWALITAVQKWRKQPQAYPEWTTEPIIETIVITGISEAPAVLMTVDNCKPRTSADVFYTSPLFRTLPPPERKECSRMLSSQIDLFWKRTDVKGYKTHPEVVAIVERHPRLLKALEHIYAENKPSVGRKIARLSLSPGQVSYLLYAMAAHDTDGDVYRNGMPPTEKVVEFNHWDKAAQFFSFLPAAPEFEAVRTALKNLVSLDDGISDQRKKFAILAKAWDAFREHGVIQPQDVELTYIEKDGTKFLADEADFFGIDCPEKSVSSTPDPVAATPQEIAKASGDELRRRAIEEANKIQAERLDAGKL